MTPTEQDKELRDWITRLSTNEQYYENLREKSVARIRVDELVKSITADRKRVALGARIDELEVTVFKPMAGKTWLDIRPDIELRRQNNRYNELKQELEKL